jgi:hypothetical protein
MSGFTTDCWAAAFSHTQSEGLLHREIGPNTVPLSEQMTKRTQTVSEGVRTHDLSACRREGSLCLRPIGHRMSCSVFSHLVFLSGRLALLHVQSHTLTVSAASMSNWLRPDS